MFTISLTGPIGAYQTATVQVRLNVSGTNSVDQGDLVAAITEAVNAYAGPGLVSFDGATVSYTADEHGQPMTPIQIRIPILEDGASETGERMSIELENSGNSGISQQAEEAPIEIQGASKKVPFLSRFKNWMTSWNQYV